MGIKAIYFDFDGTLVDSFDHALGVFAEIAERMRLRPINDIERARSIPSKKLLKEMGVSFWRLPKLVRLYQETVARDAHSLCLFPELANTLSELTRAKKYRLGILSSNHRANITRCLEANDAQHFFDEIIGYPKLFGKAKAIKRILKENDYQPRELIYIGDEARDIEAARKAGCVAVAVTWGFHARTLLDASQPDYLIQSPQEITEIVGAIDNL